METTEANRRTARVLYVVLMLFAVAAPLFGVGAWVLGLTRPVVGIEAPLEQEQPIAAPGSDAEVSVPANGAVRVEATRENAGLFSLLWQTDTLTTGLAIGAGAALLALVARSIGAGSPFDPRNPRRIALIAACVMVGGYVAPMLAFATRVGVLHRAGLIGGDSPVIWSFQADGGPLVIATLIALLAGAFRRGAALERDVAGLV